MGQTTMRMHIQNLSRQSSREGENATEGVHKNKERQSGQQVVSKNLVSLLSIIANSCVEQAVNVIVIYVYKWETVEHINTVCNKEKKKLTHICFYFVCNYRSYI